MNWTEYLRSKGYRVPTDDEDDIIRMGTWVMALERSGQPLPKYLDWSN